MQATFIASLSYATGETAAELLLVFGFGLGGGLTMSGLCPNNIDIAPRYSAFIMGISNCLGTIPGMIGPPVAGALTPNEVGSVLGFQIFLPIYIY